MTRLGQDHEAAVAVHVDEARRDDMAARIDPAPSGDRSEGLLAGLGATEHAKHVAR